MTERAGLVGGSVQVRSSPGEGTTVILSVPIDPARERPGGPASPTECLPAPDAVRPVG